MRYVFLATALLVGLLGCPSPPAPPFDATGLYMGEWWGRTDDQTQVIVACPLTLSLEQDLTKPYPGDHGVRGTVLVDYSCVDLPPWLEEMPPSETDVGGLLTDDGRLTLATGGCGPGVCLLVVLAGQGLDTTGDGHMDTYEGDWSYIILLAGVQPFGVTGGFSVSVRY